MKNKKNLFPKLPPVQGKGDDLRPRDDNKWEESEYWKTTGHYKKNKWAYQNLKIDQHLQ